MRMGRDGPSAADFVNTAPETELADVLFVLICSANQTGVDLTAALERNLEKKTHRDARRHHENPKLTGADHQ